MMISIYKGIQEPNWLAQLPFLLVVNPVDIDRQFSGPSLFARHPLQAWDQACLQ
jgi:hypothetical protein